MIDSAIAEGAQVAARGATADMPSGWFVSPTLVTDVTPEMSVARNEVFGPLLSVLTYDTEKQALELANSSRYGLSGAVWSRDSVRATDFAARMKTGQVILNGAAQNLATPFGGFGDSGFGRENGRFGIEELLTYQSIHGAS